MKKAIFLSIKPEFTKRIENGTKNYEFRNYVPKKDFELLYVYETVPTSLLKYVITIDKIVKYPDKIKENGYGNNEFNKGLKTKYAYHISSVEKLVDPIPLKILKENFGFTAPQGYAYNERYPKLTKLINDSKKTKII